MAITTSIYVPGKAPIDSLPFGFDFGQWLDVDTAGNQDTIVSATMTAAPDGLQIGNTTINGSLVQAIISAGNNGVTYLVSCVITTQTGQVAQSQQGLPVRENAR